MVRHWIPVVLAAGCGAGVSAGPRVTALRPACGDDAHWDGAACRPVGDARARVQTAEHALAEFKVDEAQAALAGAETHGPLDHDTNVKLWEQRGIAAAYLEDESTATAAFDMLLALDPAHLLSYTLSPKATFVFERARVAANERGAPGLDVSWGHTQKVGAPVPVDVEVLADPKQFLRRATVFVRKRGDASWRAADVALGAAGHVAHVTLPAFDARSATALELYARAYDDKDNEVLTWADARRPREIPLRYDPPTRWYKRWWIWVTAGVVVAAGTGIAVYAAQPPETLDVPVSKH